MGRDSTTGKAIMHDNIVRHVSKRCAVLYPSPCVFDIDSCRFRDTEEVTSSSVDGWIDLYDRCRKAMLNKRLSGYSSAKASG